ncbi:uncharacterized protein LOC125048670 isoform X2 [Pieris napi]|uniref:uncharacterized protein LOC125048670 isoform X2 n=1 Tax=Pieris napi TaxID=78633 RepID=UPI001FBAD3B7|nr:uncharacterized protein LOC125048670 isoform X2 [Pieris napi]
MEALKCKSVESILTERDIKSIVHRAASHEWTILGYDIKVAGQGLSGFLGDHFRMTVHLESGDFTKKLHLFAKFLPLLNKPKADFIQPKPWCPKAWIHTDSLIVMPDLSIEGYKSISHHECLDLQHVAVVVTSLARFHASFACFEAKRDIIHHQRNSFYKDHMSVLRESPHFDAPWTAPWLRAAAKLSFNLIQAFSNKIQKNIDDLEGKLTNLFFKACEDLEPSKDSLNVIIHRDLWINNILFRYEQGHPSEAVLLDFQCVRYAPPALDLMIFLYLTTSTEFRRAHEKEIFNQYYTVFTQHLDDTVKSKLKDYNYGRWDFFNWCERARMFAMVQAMAIFPFTLMSPSLAQKTFDNPDTFTKLMDEDRSEPVLAFARECTVYRERQLQVSEEFVERYILKPL